ncbi:ABC transporter ATP-binding protein [Methanosarcina sp.]|uniref:ABC transporter ATP-binding protein n=1 Tax=Methanosarcina sp. TaxID=2213 RepID=UPI002AB82819|nr:ABC transporter ATP-binding protein [Methanosarcina sp.]MDY9927456.1 ABC transporter ATP-binding protein [Methanosarcina sp.]
MHIVELEEIYKNYGDLRILRNINLQIEKGTSTALVGPTGSGKTVLLRLIDLLEKPSSGTIYFEGADTNGSNNTRLNVRRQIGMVFQKPLAFKASVYDNIAYGLKIRGKKEDMDERIKELLELIGLPGYENRNALKLSGGETQRLALARAMITDPKLLLLDEPTANLDPISKKKLEELILKINRESETTIIMTTHDLLQGQRLAERMVILYNGQILQSGTPDQIFRKPKNRFVADFVGIENIMSGKIEDHSNGLATIKTDSITVFAVTEKEGKVHFSIRPDEITISREKVQTSARNTIQGKVTDIIDTGSLIKLLVDTGELFTVFITRESLNELSISIGTSIWLYFKASAVHVF